MCWSSAAAWPAFCAPVFLHDAGIGRILTDMILGRENDFAAVFSPQRSVWKPQLLVNGLTAAGNLLTPTAPRCPHLGCALKRNKTERSWDCPCHGSRFEESGKLIDNPAMGGLKR